MKSELDRIATIDTELLPIPGGRITLRDDRIQQQWTVAIAAFRLSRVPVTQEVYHAVTGASPSAFSDAGEDDLPTFDAEADGYRLPSEAEWEFACRAGTTDVRYGELDAIAWYNGNADGRTHPVGLLQPNDWGLHDMLGNVWEWCNDVYDPSVYGAYRIIRGGGWNDAPRGVLATNRRRSHPVAFRIDDLGFRVARNG